MTRKLLLLSTNPSAYSLTRLAEEALLRGWQVCNIHYRDLQIHIGPKVSISCQSHFVEDFDQIILRSPLNSNLKSANFRYVAEVLVRSLKKTRSKVLNYSAWINLSTQFDKLSQMATLASHGIPVLQSFYPGLLDYIDVPYVVKSLVGSHGTEVFLVDSMDKVSQISAQLPSSGLLGQEFIDSKEDYRVIVLDGIVLGKMRRKAVGNNWRTNITLGGVGEKVEGLSDIDQIAISASQVLGLEFAGVDVIVDRSGTPHCLEIDGYPQFKGFDYYLDTNIAEKVIDYIVGK